MLLTKNKPVIFHFRWISIDGKNWFLGTKESIGLPHEKKKVHNNGGVTIVFNTETKRFGIAMCCSKDNFSKKIGRCIAYGRSKNNKTSVGMSNNDDIVTFSMVKEEASRLCRQCWR